MPKYFKFYIYGLFTTGKIGGIDIYPILSVLANFNVSYKDANTNQLI